MRIAFVSEAVHPWVTAVPGRRVGRIPTRPADDHDDPSDGPRFRADGRRIHSRDAEVA